VRFAITSLTLALPALAIGCITPPRAARLPPPSAATAATAPPVPPKEVPRDLAAPADPPTETKSYGHFTILTDIASLPFTLYWFKPGASIAYGAGSVLGAPTIHLLYGRPAASAISFGLRGVGYAASYALLQHEVSRCAEQKGFNFCMPYASLLALTTVVTTTVLVDFVVLAWHEVPREGWKRLPVAPTIDVARDRAVFGVTGLF